MSRPALRQTAPPCPVRVRTLDDDGRERWDGFVRACPEATFCHLSGWRSLVENVLGYETHFMYAEAEGEVRGVLPLGHIRTRLFGNALISAPFLVYGGIAAFDEEARAALTERARELAHELGVDYLELRQRDPWSDAPPAKELYVTFRKALAPDPEANLKAIPRKQRAMVRKGIGAGLAGEIDADTERFYPLYAQSLHQLGTPVMGQRWFRAIKDEFGDACEVLTIQDGREAVSSVMSFYFRDEVLPYYAGAGPGARKLKANDFMYWELMQRALSRGARTFDYGRSKVGTGSYSFKKNWGFEPETLHYEYHLVGASELPDVSPANPKYQRRIAAWRRLPLWVTRLIGPPIARQLG